MRRVSAMSAVILASSCVGVPNDPPESSGLAISAMTGDEACAALREEKKKHSRVEVGRSDLLLERFRQLGARCDGVADDQHARDLDGTISGDAALAAALAPDQVAAWRELDRSTHGRANVSWDRERGTLGTLELGAYLDGASADAALEDYEARFGAMVRRMLGTTNAVGMLRVAQQTSDGSTKDIPASAHARYAHTYGELGVAGDIAYVTIAPSISVPGRWRATLTARWTNERNAGSIAAKLSADDAVGRARSSGEVTDGDVAAPTRLALCGSRLTPCYEIVLDNHHGGAWYYQIDATNGQVLESANQVAHYDGSLKVQAGVPYDGTSKPYRALTHANVYQGEGYTLYGTRQHCGYTTTGSWLVGVSKIGQTDASGGYTGLVANPSSDTSWRVDLRGYYFKDVSDVADLTLPNFTAGVSGYQFGLTRDYYRSRRAELYYLANWSRQVYTSAFADWSIGEMPFQYYETSAAGCGSPTYPEDCCSGYAAGSCIYVECDADWPSERGERRFREVLFHEHNHTYRAYSAPLCGSCTGSPTTAGTECGCWEEGRAMFAGLGMGKFEHTRGEYLPSLTYPANYTTAGSGGSVYKAGAIWTAIYTDFMLQGGVRQSLGTVTRNLGTPSNTTKMVGACSSSTDYTTCPSDSFYRHLVSSVDTNFRYEVSKAFHAHVTDADRATAGNQSFPWADETPDRTVSPVFLAVENGASITVTSGPDTGSGSLRLDHADDADVFSFVGRAGKSYLIETDTLATGVDTMIDVFSGESVIEASGDDCGASTRSCLTFTTTENRLYRVRVSSYPGRTVGPSATYQFKIRMLNDDVSDGTAGAAALAPDGNYQAGVFDTGTDVDVYRVASSGSQTLSFLGCSDAGVSTKVEVIDPTSAVISMITNTSCATAPQTVTIGAGVYFLRATAATGATGVYKVKASLTADIDVNNTLANAWLLDSSDARRLVATKFDSTSDEDWYKFTTTSGHWINVETYDMANGADTVIEVYGPTSMLFAQYYMTDTSGGKALGQWMLRDDDGAHASLGSRLSFFAPVDGTYYVRVRPYSSGAGTYKLMFSDIGYVSFWAEWDAHP